MKMTFFLLVFFFKLSPVKMELKEICEQRYSGLLLFLDDFGYDFKHRIVLKGSVIEFLNV